MTRFDKYGQDMIQAAGFNSGDNKHIPMVAVVDSALNWTGGAALAAYQTNDFIEATSTQLYLGKQTASGAWLVMSIDTTSGVVIRYATVTNNPATTIYTTAWTNRATLTYGYYSEAF